MKILVSGYSRSEGVREFEILEREELESIIDDLSPAEIFQKTFDLARGYIHSGTAYTYLDARDGGIKTCWLGSNTFNHPWDSFYEIDLCLLTTGSGAIDFDTVEYLLDTCDPDEMKRWREFNGSLRDFLGDTEYEKRMENAIAWEADEFQFNEEELNRQLNELYTKADLGKS